MAMVTWRGAEIAAGILAAAKGGVDETTEAAAQHAKTNHPWTSESGDLQDAITSKPAEVEGGQVVGQFGAWGVIQAAKQELGTANMPANPYLRPAADAEYPELTSRIRWSFQ